MIEKLNLITKEELEEIATIWLESNKEAHEFVDHSYWDGNYEMVKEMFPQADIYVYRDNEKIIGFMGISDGYIAGIFINSAYRGAGIGKLFIQVAKENYPSLELSVYQKNESAYQFYLKQGFVIKQEQLEEETNEIEYIMGWNK